MNWNAPLTASSTNAFASAPGVTVGPAEALHVIIRDSDGNEVLRRSARANDGTTHAPSVGKASTGATWDLASGFHPGGYIVEARSDAGQVFRGEFTVPVDLGGVEHVAVPRAR